MSDNEIMADGASMEQPVEQQAETEVSEKTFTQSQLDEIVEQRLARERKKFQKQIEGVDLDEAKQLLQAKQEQEIERQKEKASLKRSYSNSRKRKTTR